MKRQTFHNEDKLHTALDPSSSEAMSDDPILEPKHKIFLSHSGAQKEFVDHLCNALEERCHYPFFDRCRESLPKGKKFSGLIFKAVQQCQLLVVVVSEDYFMSKWPMLELSAFVKATKERKSSTNLGILPLFYGLSMNELKDKKRRQRWYKKWETFARDDPKGLIKVDDWKFALAELTKFNGLPYDRELKQVVEYESSIVSHICKLLPPDIKWEDSHVQGRTHEVVIEKMKQVGVSRWAQVRVVGLHGVGGIGKTTVCKTLCNELSSAFEGRVCHIEFDSTSSNSKELLQKALIKLTRKSQEAVQRWDGGECKDVLYKNLMKQKTFLAIDNVWDNAYSIKQAKMFLKAPFHRESLVLLTTRAQRTLELLRMDGVSCLEMPEIGQRDATNLFLHYAANGQQFTSEEDMRSIDLCVQRCYFSKGDGRGFHYHPLALEALGRQLGCHGNSPFEWVQVLSSLQNFNTFSGENEVFDVLRSSFDLLPLVEQALFMDMGVFLQGGYDLFGCSPGVPLLEHLCVVYKQDEQKMLDLLNSLKGKGLFQNVYLSTGRITMHDLYCKFVVLEAKGKLVQATNLGNRRWAYLDVCDGDLSELEVTPAGGCWQNLTRLSIRQNDDRLMESLVDIEWRYFSNVLVLGLYGLKSVKGTLNLKGMKCLRSLCVHNLLGIEGLEGLEGLTNLTLFHWNGRGVNVSFELKIPVEFPRSLKYLYIFDNRVLLGMDALARCKNLCKLELVHVEVGVQLDLSNCLSLEHVSLRGISELQSLLVPCKERASRLHSFEVDDCKQLQDIPGLGQLVCLEHLDLVELPLKELPTLQCLTKLQNLKIDVEIDFNDLHIPRQLQKFCYMEWTESIKLPNLSGLNQLQILDLSNCMWTSMSGLGDLPALRSLDLCNWGNYCGCLI